MLTQLAGRGKADYPLRMIRPFYLELRTFGLALAFANLADRAIMRFGHDASSFYAANDRISWRFFHRVFPDLVSQRVLH
jgi:hypothetical protein